MVFFLVQSSLEVGAFSEACPIKTDDFSTVFFF